MPDTPDNGLTCECGEVARVHDFTALGQIPKHRIGTGYICPCREFKSAELARVRREGTPGVMHSVDQAFHDLAIKERDAAWTEIAALKAENATLREENELLESYCVEWKACADATEAAITALRAKLETARADR